MVECSVLLGDIAQEQSGSASIADDVASRGLSDEHLLIPDKLAVEEASPLCGGAEPVVILPVDREAGSEVRLLGATGPTELEGSEQTSNDHLTSDMYEEVVAVPLVNEGTSAHIESVVLVEHSAVEEVVNSHPVLASDEKECGATVARNDAALVCGTTQGGGSAHSCGPHSPDSNDNSHVVGEVTKSCTLVTRTGQQAIRVDTVGVDAPQATRESAVELLVVVTDVADKTRAPLRFVLRSDGMAVIKIGKSPQCDVVLDYRGVSAVHAELRLLQAKGASLCVRDVSTNGTGLRKLGDTSTGLPSSLVKGSDFSLPDGSMLLIPMKLKADNDPDKASRAWLRVQYEPLIARELEKAVDAGSFAATDSGTQAVPVVAPVSASKSRSKTPRRDKLINAEVTPRIEVVPNEPGIVSPASVAVPTLAGVANGASVASFYGAWQMQHPGLLGYGASLMPPQLVVRAEETERRDKGKKAKDDKRKRSQSGSDDSRRSRSRKKKRRKRGRGGSRSSRSRSRKRKKKRPRRRRDSSSDSSRSDGKGAAKVSGTMQGVGAMAARPQLNPWAGMAMPPHGMNPWAFVGGPWAMPSMGMQPGFVMPQVPLPKAATKLPPGAS